MPTAGLGKSRPLLHPRFARRCPYNRCPHQPVEIGKAVVKYDDGDDIAILYEGAATTAAYEGYLQLKETDVKCKLVDILSIKPLDRSLLEKLFLSVKGIVTVENHSVLGSLGGAVAECMAESVTNCKLARVGIEDVFTESGALAALKQKYGIWGDNVKKKAMHLL